MNIELWESPEGLDGISVSSFGRVVDASGEEVETKSDQGYPFFISMNGYPQRVFIHVLVAHVFIGPRKDGDVVMHLDDLPWHNRLSNLQYGTRKQNSLSLKYNRGERGSTLCPYGHSIVGGNILEARNRALCKACFFTYDPTTGPQQGLANEMAYLLLNDDLKEPETLFITPKQLSDDLKEPETLFITPKQLSDAKLTSFSLLSEKVS